MPRVKRGVTAHRRHKKVLKQAKGYYGARSRVFPRARTGRRVRYIQQVPIVPPRRVCQLASELSSHHDPGGVTGRGRGSF